MQNLIAKLRQQTSIISKKPGFLSGKFLQITQDLNKMQKIPQSFVGIGKQETCAKFQQKIFNCRVVGAPQSF